MTTTSLDKSVEAIRAAAKRLEGDARFKVVFEETPGLAQADITAWQDWLREQPEMQDYTIPKELCDIYRATGGFRFRWQYLPAKQPTIGSAELVDLMSLYQRDDEGDKPVSVIYEDARPFDIIDQQELVAIRFKRDSANPVSLVRKGRNSGTERALSLQPVQYVQMMSEFMARYGWQRLFDESRPAASGEIDKLRREVAALTQKGEE